MVVVFNFPNCFPLQNVFLQMANIFLQMANVFVHRLQGERRLQCGNPRPLRRPSSIPAIIQTALAASISYITNIWPMHVDIEHI